MRLPEALMAVQDLGVIDEVIRPLMSGKEAQVFLVRVGDEICVAKVYKEAENRSFKHRSTYTEGRKVRNSRQQRAIEKRSKFGREEEEAAWKSAEVDAIHRLSFAGVNVPTPYDFVEGVLVMSLVADHRGEPAPRLADVRLEPDEARHLFGLLVREVVKMLCAGLVHGDLSDFNVLLGADRPMIIDFPQATDAATNQNARRLLVRDVHNLQHFLARFAPELAEKQYGDEIWELYEKGELRPDSALSGRAKSRKGRANTEAIMQEIAAARQEEQQRRKALGLEPLPEPPRDVRPPRRDAAGGRGRGDAPRGDDRPPREGAPRGDRPRDDRPPRDGAPRGERPRDDRPPRDDRQPRAGAPRDDRPRRDDASRDASRRDDRARGDDGNPRRDERGPRREERGHRADASRREPAPSAADAALFDDLDALLVVRD